MRSFSAVVSERIGWYVYALVDPRDGSVFYIGKGTGNRVFAHAAAAIDPASEATAKLDRIRAIHDEGLEVECFLIRHGIASERQAYDVEASVIDAFRLLAPDLTSERFQLTNAVLGHGHELKGLAHATQVASLYDAPPAPAFEEPVLLLRIPGLWTPQMTATQLYEATRGWWVIGPDRRAAARYACAVNKGVIRAVYRIDSWRERRQGDRDWEEDLGKRPRWGFAGVPAPEMDRYVDTSVAHLFKRGEVGPVKLVGPVTQLPAAQALPETQAAAADGAVHRDAVAATGPILISSAAGGQDRLLSAVTDALEHEIDRFKVEVRTARYPGGVAVWALRLLCGDGDPSDEVRFEATGPAYLPEPMSEAQLQRMRDLGWGGPQDWSWVPSVHWSKTVDPQDVGARELAELVVATLRDVFGAVEGDEYTLTTGPEQPAAEAHAGAAESASPGTTTGVGNTGPTPAAPQQPQTLQEADDLWDEPADEDTLGDVEPWIHHLQAAWQMAAGTRLLGSLPRPMAFPRAGQDPAAMPVLPATQAQWTAVLHLLVFGCGWWRPGATFAQSTLPDAHLAEGHQWLVWKVLGSWPGHDLLEDFLAWAAAGGDDHIAQSMPIPEAIRAAYPEPAAHTRDSGGLPGEGAAFTEYRKMWRAGLYDPLQLLDHLAAPWRAASSPVWRSGPGRAGPATHRAGVESESRLRLTVDTYDGWYAELCRRGLAEPAPVLVAVNLRQLGELGTFRIGGGHRPHLVVDDSFTTGAR